MLDHFCERGYSVVPTFLTEVQVDRLRARIEILVDNGYESGEPPVIFGPGSTHDQELRFLDSGDRAQVLHHRVPDGTHASYVGAVDRIGHGLHVVDPVVREVIGHPDLTAVLDESGVEDPTVVESLFLRKGDNVGALHVHIDHWYLFTLPASVVLLWFALEPADVENGCLYVSPDGPITTPTGRMRRHDDRATLDSADDMPSFHDLVPVPVNAGSLVVVDGRLPHASGPRRAGAPTRDALGVHVIDGTAALPDDLYLGATCTPVRVGDIFPARDGA